MVKEIIITALAENVVRSLALALKAELETEIEQEIILISSTTFQVSGTKVLTLMDNHSAVLLCLPTW